MFEKIEFKNFEENCGVCAKVLSKMLDFLELICDRPRDVFDIESKLLTQETNPRSEPKPRLQTSKLTSKKFLELSSNGSLTQQQIIDNPHLINATDQSGLTPLMLAVSQELTDQHVKIAQNLCEYGADVMATDSANNSVFMWAVSTHVNTDLKAIEVINFLLGQGMRIQNKDRNNIQEWGGYGQSMALYQDRYEEIEEKKIAPNQKGGLRAGAGSYFQPITKVNTRELDNNIDEGANLLLTIRNTPPPKRPRAPEEKDSARNTRPRSAPPKYNQERMMGYTPPPRPASVMNNKQATSPIALSSTFNPSQTIQHPIATRQNILPSELTGLSGKEFTTQSIVRLQQQLLQPPEKCNEKIVDLKNKLAQPANECPDRINEFRDLLEQLKQLQQPQTQRQN